MSYPIPNKPHCCLNLQSQVGPDPEEDPRWVEQETLSHAQAAPICDRKNNQIVTEIDRQTDRRMVRGQASNTTRKDREATSPRHSATGD